MVAKKLARLVEGEVVEISHLSETFPETEPVFVLGGDGTVGCSADKAEGVLLLAGRGTINRVRRGLVEGGNRVGLNEFLDNWAMVALESRPRWWGLSKGDKVEFVNPKRKRQSFLEQPIKFYTNVQLGSGADWVRYYEEARKKMFPVMAHLVADVKTAVIQGSGPTIDKYYSNEMGTGSKLGREKIRQGEGRIVRVSVKSPEKATLFAKYMLLRMAAHQGWEGKGLSEVDYEAMFTMEFPEPRRLNVDGEAVTALGDVEIRASNRFSLMTALGPGWEFERVSRKPDERS